MTDTDKTYKHHLLPTMAPEALPAPLSPHWAFVVQLRQGTPLTPMGMQGRVEHLSSGKATTFHSLEELRAFMERIVAELCVEHPPRSATTDDATCNGYEAVCTDDKKEVNRVKT